MVDRLVKRELVTRRENESDRRLSKVELTAEGQSAVVGMRTGRSVWFEEIINAMPGDKRRALLDGLEGFLKAALAKGGDTGRTCRQMRYRARVLLHRERNKGRTSKEQELGVRI